MSEAFDPVEASLILGAALGHSKADPLALFVPASYEQERVLMELGRGEILFGGANKIGKTSLAKLFVALSQGRGTLGGYILPSVPQPSQWVVASLDFTQQHMSVQPKYLEAVGDWPHREKWDGETLRSLRIRYEGCRSDDPKDWSRITFISAKNLQSGTGFRGNGYHCDEPPPMWLLRELRKMADAGQMVIGVIGATLVKRSQWQPLREDYPVGFEGKWHGRYLRIRGPAFNPDDLDDLTIGNRFLTRADKEDMLAMYPPGPQRDIRILGLEVNDEGANPLRDVVDEIARQMDAARDGDVTEWKVSREVPTPTGKQLVTELVEVESWEDSPRKGHVYRVLVDTSLGIADGAHDPGMAQVVDMTDAVQVARYEGFVGEYGLGVLAGALSKKWAGADVDVATTGGYGEVCLSGLRALGCRNIVSRQVTGKDGRIDRTDIGFKETEATRMESFGALREVFIAARAGHPYLTIRSRADLAQLIDLSVDEKNRVIRVPGVHHGESVVLLGRFASLCSPEKRRRTVRPEYQRPADSPAAAMRRAAGLPVERHPREKPIRSRIRPAYKWRTR